MDPSFRLRRISLSKQNLPHSLCLNVPALFYTALMLLSIPRMLPFPCLWTAHMNKQLLNTFAMTFAKAATQRKVQCHCTVSKYTSYKLDITILNCLKTYKFPLGKSKTLEKWKSQWKLWCDLSNWKKKYKSGMKSHHFSNDNGNCAYGFARGWHSSSSLCLYTTIFLVPWKFRQAPYILSD